MENTEQIDPSVVGLDNGNYFGLSFTPEESRLVLLSVPWDVTASYGGGACYAPDAIIGASRQLDLYDSLNPQGWREGIGTLPIDYSIQEASMLLRGEAKKVMRHLGRGGKLSEEIYTRRLERINKASHKMNEQVMTIAKEWLSKGKLVGVVGGDHSTPFGLMSALAEREENFSILQIDAHADLHDAFEGFEHSHGSIMFNAINSLKSVEKLVQVGLRDVCDIEVRRIAENPKITVFKDFDLAMGQFGGETWHAQCQRIVEALGERVYVSFDIDGLSADNAPHTGTPVPGGLSFNQAVYLLHQVVESGRTIIGFDLCEVVPSQTNEWDANVGARILYKLANLTLKSNK